MSLTFYYFSLIIAIIIESLFFLIIGIPLLLIGFWLLNKYNIICVSNKKRIVISVVTNFLLAILIGIYIYLDPYLNDNAFDYTMRSNGLSIPIYYASDVNYPEENNGGDDFGVDKTLRLIGNLSQKDVHKLAQIVSSDARWTMVGNVYHFEDCQYENETRIIVDIDLSKNTVRTSYLKW